MNPQTPAAHVVPDVFACTGHGDGEFPSPSALHVCRVVALAQLTAPGVHARVMHTPSRQLSPEAHATGVYPRPSAVHVRRVDRSAHETAPAAHTCARHAPIEHAVAPTQADGM